MDYDLIVGECELLLDQGFFDEYLKGPKRNVIRQYVKESYENDYELITEIAPNIDTSFLAEYVEKYMDSTIFEIENYLIIYPDFNFYRNLLASIFSERSSEEYIFAPSVIGIIGEGIAGFIMESYYNASLSSRPGYKSYDFQMELIRNGNIIDSYVEAKNTTKSNRLLENLKIAAIGLIEFIIRDIYIADLINPIGIGRGFIAQIISTFTNFDDCNFKVVILEIKLPGVV